MKIVKKIVCVSLLFSMLFWTACSSEEKKSPDATTEQKAVVQLDEEAERAASGKVLKAYTEARYETFDAEKAISSGINGNDIFLNYLKDGYSKDEISAHIDSARQSMEEYYARLAAEWAEFTSAGGYIEYGAGTSMLIQEGHYYYDECMRNFEQDEDTCFIDPAGVEAFIDGGIGIDWYVPYSMESDWGETRYEESDLLLVRYEGQWYIAPINYY